MHDELYHYGVKGMRWGVRRTPQQLGHKVVQKKMSVDERKVYAKERIKRRGARQAIEDETDRFERTRKTAAAVSGAALGGAFLGMAASSLTLNVPGMIASGAAFVTSGAGSVIAGEHLNTVAKYARRNQEAIARIAGIPDITIGRRYNDR